jgi:glycerol-3-phosphate dehydrogenase subunit C
MEGGTKAPVRHPIPWQDPAFTDAKALDGELRRVFDICHGCRRCFNLCDSFPRLFDLIDGSKSGELDSVSSDDFTPVIDACTLCDLCFMTKCPYVPPHEFDLDFPHLMLRARAAQNANGEVPWVAKQIRKTDRNGRLASSVAWLANWVTRTGNWLTRQVLQAFAGIHRRARVPKYHAKTLMRRAKDWAKPTTAPARKVVLFATCSGNHNNPEVGVATHAILAKAGVEVAVANPGCCGMPQLELGDIAAVAQSAEKVSAELGKWIADGYDVVALTPSCALMLKFEWPLILHDHAGVKILAAATSDAAEYIVDLVKSGDLPGDMALLDGSVALHLACHARAQNMGPKAADLLELIPDSDVTVIERCSGHGGAWGMEVKNFPVALKIGKPVARKAVEIKAKFVASECPLAGDHIAQGMEELDPSTSVPRAWHPIELFAMSYCPESSPREPQ